MKRTFCLALLLAANAAAAEDARVTLSTTVTGNREQPRVMYILPWQRPGELGQGVQLEPGIADELFVPVDRDEFVRELALRARLERDRAAGAAEPLVAID